MSDAPFVLLAAGGTGGHLFPAEALAAALARRGVAVELATDSRAAGYARNFPGRAVHALPAGTPTGGGPVRKALAIAELLRGTLAARSLLRRHRPAAVVGFGGYPSVPPVLAATRLGIPAIVHEQNAVIGRANRFLAGRVQAIATGFPEVRGVPADRIRHVGNPVRPAVLEAAETPYAPLTRDGKFRLAVFGGSQGARVMSEIVPEAVERLEEPLRRRLAIVQQARAEDADAVRAAYDRLGVEAEIAPFFKDLPRRLADSHLVVGRAGASTVAELAVIGRPAILVPLPGAIDQDQAANAASLGAIGAATVLMQPEFTPARLVAEIRDRFANPETLTRAAALAKSAGIPDAADRLADLVIGVAAIAPGRS